MSHQGNIFLSYNLALIVSISKQFLDGNKEKIESRINDTIKKHLRVRFNKKDDAEKDIKDAAIDEMFETRVKHFRLGTDTCANIRSIKKRDENIGKVYIFLFFDNNEHNSESVKTRLKEQDSQIRIENFNIDSTCNGADEESISRELYHLASRICGAFVEYRPNFHNISHDNLDKNCSGAASKALSTVDVINAAQPLKPDMVVKKILDIQDAIDLICDGLDGSMNYFPPIPECMKRIFDEKPQSHNGEAWVRYKFPFGVWFRGQARMCYGLTPSLFHESKKNSFQIHDGCKKTKSKEFLMYDETSMVQHFMLHKPEFRHKFHDLFDWLCLMQHYNAPTRLLDWTENILIALYFAVWETDVDCDGAVWVLNAGRLNQHTRLSSSRRHICTPGSADVFLRSALAVSRTKQELKTTLIKQKLLEEVLHSVNNDEFTVWLTGKQEVSPASSVLHKLASPVAVFPNRANERFVNQSAMFTLHGGKAYDPQIEIPEKEGKFHKPISLLELSQDSQKAEKNGEQFLDAYIVPSCAKRKLREQLKRLGVHIASVFPELEYQAKYIRHQWRFEES